MANTPLERDNRNPGTYRTMPIWNAPFVNTALSYALFPFQGQLANGRRQIEVEPASCIHQARFRLTLTCDKSIDFAKDVEPALWAWVNFGGIGGRTRRGVGSIRGREVTFDGTGKIEKIIRDLAPSDVNDFVSLAKGYLANSQSREWPTLAAALLYGNAHENTLEAWDFVIGKFRYFRQGEGRGRNPRQQDSNRPGRSRYPEPETIRRVTGQRSNQHARLPQIPDDAFPRAELGLPIVFHFPPGQGEPPDTVLYPSAQDGQKRERMASPLILKPLALQNGKAIPLILLLKTPPLSGVDLRRGDTSLTLPPTTAIRSTRLSSYRNPDSPLAESPNGSALEAFLALAQTEGFTEVTQ